MNFFSALTSFDFLTHALLGGLLASVACGIVGAFVVVRRIGYMAGGIAHAVLGGMGIAYYLGQPPMGGHSSAHSLLHLSSVRSVAILPSMKTPSSVRCGL